MSSTLCLLGLCVLLPLSCHQPGGEQLYFKVSHVSQFSLTKECCTPHGNWVTLLLAFEYHEDIYKFQTQMTVHCWFRELGTPSSLNYDQELHKTSTYHVRSFVSQRLGWVRHLLRRTASHLNLEIFGADRLDRLD